MKRKTIQHSVSISGTGLHTGQTVNMKLNPTESGQGISFKRVDLESPVKLKADVSLVTRTERGTTIAKGDVEVSTIEHLMAAIAGAQITDLEIELDASEVPILDGSSYPFVQLLKQASFTDLEGDIECFEIKEIFTYRDENTHTEITVVPYDGFELNVMIDFESEMVAAQSARLQDISQFSEDIADSRTFVFIEDLERLYDAGLIQGGDVDNAVVITKNIMEPQELDRIKKKFGKEDLEIDDNGIASLTSLRSPNELAKHKLLDLLGDLYLLGRPIKGKIFANRPGHKANTTFTKLLKSEFQKARKYKGKPDYNPNIDPVMGIADIQNMLPHRHPFLLVDKIIDIKDNYVVGVKSISFGEWYFRGHFPDNPVFPGVLQMEALAQTGGILALTLAGDGGKWDTYFLKMDNVKFKYKVVPGDVMIMKLELLAPIRRGIVHMKGTIFVGNRLVSEGELTAQIVKREE